MKCQNLLEIENDVIDMAMAKYYHIGSTVLAHMLECCIEWIWINKLYDKISFCSIEMNDVRTKDLFLLNSIFNPLNCICHSILFQTKYSFYIKVKITFLVLINSNKSSKDKYIWSKHVIDYQYYCFWLI